MNSRDRTTNLAHNLARSFRPRMILLSWAVYSSVVIIWNGLDFISIALGLLLFIATYGIVALQNDLSDKSTDEINNRRDIPYAKDLLTERQLVWTMFGLSGIATIVGLLLNQFVLLWVGLYILLGYSYSGPLNIKSRGVYAAMLLGFCYGAMPWLLGALVTGHFGEVSLMWMALSSFVFSTGIIVLKDFKDIKGDKATHKRTLLVIKGPVYTRYYYLAITSVAYALLAAYSYLATGAALFAMAGIAIGTFNYWLLHTKDILSKPATRATNGKWARALFFAYALAAYYVIAIMK